jgi:hypothetical protein
MRGIHYEIDTERSIGPVAIGTTGTGQTGRIVDRRGFRRVQFVTSFGTITATNAAFTLRLLEGDVTSAMTSIADADLEGTEALAVPPIGTRVDNVNRLTTRRIGYKGNRRFVQARLSSTVTAGTLVGVAVVLSEPEVAPVPGQ